MKLPGTKIECVEFGRAAAENVMNGLFAGGGLVLSQIASVAGMELYCVQNWVRRGFVSSPVQKKYSRRQFCRLVIINMLKDSMNISDITGLLSYINGDLADESDDRVGDDLIYLGLTELLSVTESDEEPEVFSKAKKIAEETSSGEAALRLQKVLPVMYFGFRASQLISRNRELIKEIND